MQDSLRIVGVASLLFSTFAWSQDQEPRVDTTPHLSLDAAISLALEANIDIAIRRLDPRIAATEHLEARSPFDPSLDYSFSYRENDTPRSAEQIAADGRRSSGSRTTNHSVNVGTRTAIGTDIDFTTTIRNRESTFNSFSDEYTTFTGFELRQPLLKNFGVENNLSNLYIAQREISRTHLQFTHEVQSIVQQVHLAYYDLAFAQADLKALQTSLDLALQLKKDNQARLELGAMTPLDVSQADADAATRRGAVLNARQAVHEAQNALKLLIYRDIGSNLAASLKIKDSLPPPDAQLPVQLHIGKGLANRADYQALLASAEQNDIRLKFRHNQLMPQIDLTATFGYNGLEDNLPGSYDRAFEDRNKNWSVGLTFSIPWDNRLERSRLESSKLAKQQTLLQIKKLEQSIMAEVDNAFHRLKLTREQIDTTLQARTSAEKNLAAEQEKLLEGATTSFLVLQFQRDLITAQSRELRALSDYHKAKANLLRSQGTLLERHGIRIEPPPPPLE